MTSTDTAVCLLGKSLAKRAAKKRVRDHRAVPLDLRNAVQITGRCGGTPRVCWRLLAQIHRATHTDA